MGYRLKPEKLFLELEQLLEQNGYQTRKERGCLLYTSPSPRDS